MELKIMLKTIEQTIEREQLVETEEPIVVAVSGGADSMVLLDVLEQLLGNRLIVAHLNHKFRGKAAVSDADFVRMECDKRSIDCVVREIDVPAEMERMGTGAQDTARSVRYQFLYQVACEYGAGAVAFGHNADDQAETVLMRIIRGTGMYGLSGIPYKRDNAGVMLIRPLLDVTRQDIEQYAKEQDLTYISDQSNFSIKYFRNLTRLEILPYLEQYNPRLSYSLRQLAGIARDENDYLDNVARLYIKESVKRDKDQLAFDVRGFNKLEVAIQRRVIHQLLKEYRMRQETTYRNIEDIIQLAANPHPSKSLDLVGIKVYRQYDNLIFKRISKNKKHSYSYLLEIPSEKYIEELGKTVKIMIDYKKQNSVGESNLKEIEVFDRAKLNTDYLLVRSRKDGDRIDLIGLGGSTKLKDLFINLKIPQSRRMIQPIVATNEKILWLPGLRRSQHALVNECTKEYVYVQFK